MVLVDTSVWIQYVERSNPLVEREMDMLLRAGLVVTAGLVLAELRQGCKTSKQAKQLLARLRSLPYLEVKRDHWIAAGQIIAESRARGQQLKIADCLFASLALSEDCEIFTLDQDFSPSSSRE